MGFQKVRTFFIFLSEMIILRLGNPNDLHMYLRTPWIGKTLWLTKPYDWINDHPLTEKKPGVQKFTLPKTNIAPKNDGFK